MGKYSKRRINRTKANRLPAKDKAVYYLLLILWLASIIGMMVAVTAIQDAVAFADEAVFAANSRASLLWAAPFAVILFFRLLILWATKFGEGYRFFQRKKESEERVASIKKKRTNHLGTKVFIVLLLISVLLVPFSFFGGDYLTDDSVITYNALNKENGRYNLAEAEHIEFETLWNRTKHSRTAQCRMVIYIAEGEKIEFYLGDFRNRDVALEKMIEIKEKFGQDKIKYNLKIDIDTFIYEMDFTFAQAEKVHILFGQQ